MFSGALAGVLKVGAVAITAAGLGTSVYFIAQVGDAEDETSRLQAPATALQTPYQLSPPNTLTPTPTTSPTFPPAPITPPAVDTSDWKRYTSPQGFSVRFPPDWRARARGSLRLLNPPTAHRYDDALAAGEVHVRYVAGMAEFRVSIGGWDRFEPDSLIDQCQSPGVLYDDPPGQAKLVTFLGRRAVLCERILFADVGFSEPTELLGYRVEFPPGHTSTISLWATNLTPEDTATMAGILSSFRFDGPVATPVPVTPTGP